MTITNGNDVTGWNAPELKQYVDQRFLDYDKATVTALQAAEKAVTKAEIATDKRFDTMTADADRRQEELSAQLDTLETSMHKGEGSASTSQLLWSRILPMLLAAVNVGVIIYLAVHK